MFQWKNKIIQFLNIYISDAYAILSYPITIILIDPLYFLKGGWGGEEGSSPLNPRIVHMEYKAEIWYINCYCFIGVQKQPHKRSFRMIVLRSSQR